MFLPSLSAIISLPGKRSAVSLAWQAIKGLIISHLCLYSAYVTTLIEQDYTLDKCHKKGSEKVNTCSIWIWIELMIVFIIT